MHFRIGILVLTVLVADCGWQRSWSEGAHAASPTQRSGTCTRGEAGRPFVEVVVKQEARPFLQTANFTDAEIKQSVNTELAARHIGCVQENAVLPGSEDWIFVAVSAATGKQTAPLQIEISVRNGASVTNQIIRWEGLRLIASKHQEVRSAIASLIKALAAEYDSPGYRAGRREEQ